MSESEEPIEKEPCCVCREAPSKHRCVVCFDGVCWKHNWAKSCFAVCVNCRVAEIKSKPTDELEEASLCEDWQPLSEMLRERDSRRASSARCATVSVRGVKPNSRRASPADFGVIEVHGFTPSKSKLKK